MSRYINNCRNAIILGRIHLHIIYIKSCTTQNDRYLKVALMFNSHKVFVNNVSSIFSINSRYKSDSWSWIHLRTAVLTSLTNPFPLRSFSLPKISYCPANFNPEVSFQLMRHFPRSLSCTSFQNRRMCEEPGTSIFCSQSATLFS